MQRSRTRWLVAASITIAALGLPSPATAAPTEQRVRIEGRSTTLFEGSILTTGHALKASSDRTPRRCDGTNNGANPSPGPTPTAAADDAMRLAGLDFDATWFDGFDDYYLTRFGPDREDLGVAASWGILVNGIYTSVGGCQYRMNPGDLAFWVYDAFTMRPLLRLDGPSGIGEPTADVEGGPSTAPTQQQFTIGVDQPFPVRAIQNEPTGDIGAAGARKPAPNVMVAPVATAANGVQTVLRGDPSTKTTDADGRTTLSWSTPGLYRIKADADRFVRSNRLDVCVEPSPGAGCGPEALQAPQTPPPTTVPQPKPNPIGSGSTVTSKQAGALPDFRVGGATVSGLRITTDGNPTALVGVRWTVPSGTVGSWRIESRPAGQKRARWKTAARGTSQVSTLLDLPVGRSADLRIGFTADGATVTKALGTVVVPTDDRVRQVRFGGKIVRERDGLAWRLTVTRMRRGATLSTRLPAGRPTLVVRSERKDARIELRTGGARPQRLTIRGSKDGRTRIVSGRRQQRAGAVRVKVLSGSVRVDGVAVRP